MVFVLEDELKKFILEEMKQYDGRRANQPI